MPSNKKQKENKKPKRAGKKSKPRPSLVSVKADGATSIAAAYQPAKRQAYYRTREGRNPGTVRVQGLELVSVVQTRSSQLPELQISHSVNPSNPLLFPRLSSLAKTFERYTLKHPGGMLKFHYDGECPSSTPGVVLGYFGYDPVGPLRATIPEILDEKTNLKCASWYPGGKNSCLDVDTKAQFSDWLFTAAQLSGADDSLTPAQVRQQYLGNVNLYCFAGPSSGVLAGFFWVEYDIEFDVQIAQTAVSIAAAGPSNVSVAAGATQFWPLQEILSMAGIEPETAIAPTSAYTDEGGDIGAADAARAALQAGQYLVELYSSWSAAAAEEKKGKDEAWTTIKDFRPREVSFPREPKKCPRFPKCVAGISSCRGMYHAVGQEAVAELARQRVDLPEASGDITYKIDVYDITDGVMDPDFPVSNVGMTNVAALNQAVTFAGTGAYNPIGIGPVFAPFFVPADHIYAIRPYVVLGATTGRDSVSGLHMTINRISGSNEISPI